MLTITQKVIAVKTIAETKSWSNLDPTEILQATITNADGKSFRHPEMASELVANVSAETGYRREAVAALLPEVRKNVCFAQQSNVQDAMAVHASGTHI